jgi:hypothetical protein
LVELMKEKKRMWFEEEQQRSVQRDSSLLMADRAWALSLGFCVGTPSPCLSQLISGLSGRRRYLSLRPILTSIPFVSMVDFNSLFELRNTGSHEVFIQQQSTPARSNNSKFDHRRRRRPPVIWFTSLEGP